MKDVKIARHKRTRHWAVYDADGLLVCVCVYRRGAESLVRRLRRMTLPTSPGPRRTHPQDRRLLA